MSISRTMISMQREDLDERMQQLMQKPIRELADLLRTETEKFLLNHSSDDSVGLALFACAITCHDEEAWKALYTQYAPLVLTWVTQQPNSASLVVQEGAEPLVNASFAKFSAAMTPEKLSHFHALGSLLKYLKLCVYSTVSDSLRTHQRFSLEDSLDLIEIEKPATDDPASEALNKAWFEQIWQVIQSDLLNEKERIVMSLSYIQGLRPGEIHELHADLFPSVHDIYQVKRNVLDRLRRNRELQEMYV